MSSQVIILQLALLGVVLESDVGLRRIGWFRVARPIIVVCIIAPTYLKNLPTSGHNLLFQGLGALVGAALGTLAVSPLFVEVGFITDFRSHWARFRHKSGVPAIVSRAGGGYAAIWIVLCVLRLAFAYGATHVFSHSLGTFLANNSLSEQGLTNTLIFLTIAMDLFRSVGLVTRRHRVKSRLPREALHAPVTPSDHSGPPASSTTDGSPHPGVAALKVGASALGTVSGVLIDRRVDREQERAERRRRRRRR